MNGNVVYIYFFTIYNNIKELSLLTVFPPIVNVPSDSSYETTEKESSDNCNVTS